MRPTVAVESKGSMWYFNETERKYIRAPKTEGPRWSPPDRDWGGPNAEPGLQDLVIHEFETFTVTEDELRVDLGERFVRAPLLIPYGGLEPPDNDQPWVYEYDEEDWRADHG